MKNKLLFIFTLLFFGSLFSQVPTFITSQKYSAVGAGASGVPSVTFNVPAGKNRLMVVNALVERHHNPLSSNHPTTPNSGGFYRLDINFNSNTYSAAAISTARGPGMTANEVNERVFTFTQFTGLINLETNAVPAGPTTITFPNLNLPGAASDEMSVIISVYENVKGTRTSGNFFPRTNDTSETNLGIFTGNFNTSFIPFGRTLTDVMFVTNTGITQASALTLTPGSNWTSSANMNNIVPNTVGWPAGGNVFTTNNTPIGISSVTANTNITSGQPSYTLTRANTGPIEAGIASMYALIPFASPSVIGNVFQDHNGPANIDGIGTNAGGLYVNVINNTGNLVYSAAVNASGVFTIPSGILTEGNTYSYQLSKNTGTIGATAPLKELPASWYTVGESRNPTGNDGLADGTISFKLGDENVSGLNFGINATCLVSASNPDSDGDGVADDCDLDDDNDGILDTAECSNTINDLVTVYGAGGLIDIAPSDFGLALGVRNQNVSADLSSKFGYPANSGAVIVSINDASVHPTSNAWWIKNGEQPSVWNVSGKMSTFVLMSQNPEYYGQDSKTIHIYDGAGVIPITVPGLANQTAVPGTWSITETPFAKTLSNLRTEQVTPVSPPGGNWRYANMNFGAKTFGFSTTTKYADPTYAVLMYLECDTDGDGIPNRLDLDSDNDGCVDALEGGANFVTSNLVNSSGTVTVGFGSTASNQNLGTSIDANGIPSVANGGQPVGNSQNGAIKSANCKTSTGTPIVCSDAKVYVVMQNTAGISGITSLYTIDMITGATTTIKNPILPTTEGSYRRINCIGYNSADGFIYGYRSQTNQIVKIDALGNYELITIPGLVTADISAATAGDVRNNVLYIFDNGQARIWKINLSTLAVTITPFTLPNANDIYSIQINDFAFGQDGNIYGILTDKRLFKLNLMTNALTYLGNATGTGIAAETGSWGTAFVDAAGNLYVGNNTSRNTYKFEYNSSTNSYGLAATLFTNAQATGQLLADGASCTFVLPPNPKVDTVCLPNSAYEQTTYIKVLNNDIKGTFDINPASTRLIDPVTSLPSTSITIAGQGTFTVNITTGEIIFNSLATFTEASIKYIVRDINGNVSTPVSIILTTCTCVKSPVGGAPNGYTKVGITVQQKQATWPESIPNGHMALESKNKGFVITRVNHVSLNPLATDSISEPKEGMIVYDIQDKCVKLFNGQIWKCIYKTCNDSN